MDCVNHTGVTATAYCQNCGKALCATCMRNAPGGHVYCEPCYVAWQGMQQPFAVPPAGTPSPAAAAVLGLIPGVGAMYNGQFIKGLIHVVIFAVLVNMTSYFGIFGLFIAAWIIYQSFEAYHTAVARRDGLPLPDPLGLNELSNLFTVNRRTPPAGQPGAGPTSTGASGAASTAGPATAGYQAPYSPPPGGYVEPPVPPVHWKRREPIAAIVLIGIGVILLLGQMGYMAERIMHYLWPLLLIGLGVWLIVRRMGDTKGGEQ